MKELVASMRKPRSIGAVQTANKKKDGKDEISKIRDFVFFWKIIKI